MSISTKTTGSAAVGLPADSIGYQENLRRLDRLANLGLVSAGIAHEIKNGLVPVKTYVEILLEKGADAEMAEMVRREQVAVARRRLASDWATYAQDGEAQEVEYAFAAQAQAVAEPQQRRYRARKTKSGK